MKPNPFMQLLDVASLGSWQHAIERGLNEIRFSLLNAKAYWQITMEAPTDWQTRNRAIWFVQYYVDNAAHRLFSTRERLAQFINHACSLGFLMEAGSPKRARGKQTVSFHVVSGCSDLRERWPEVAEQLDLVSGPNWSLLDTYRHEEGHRLDPLIEDPFTDAAQRLFGVPGGDGAGVSLDSKSTYEGEQLISVFCELLQQLSEVCTDIVG